MDGGNSRLALEIGSIVAGKYRIDRILAEGGMGVVVAATHLHLDQAVALKFLRRDVSAELDAVARFTREAKAAAQLRSEHVAHVLDAGVTEDGTPYMAMEYLEGQSLALTLQSQGRLDVVAAVEYVIQACEGLAEAHSRGIVHRDIKPDNLFLLERAPGWNAIKVLDFGISKFAFSDPGNIATGVILGSPCYMSPEQLRSTATVDHRTDLWSLGATLYELIVGCAAFDASQTLPELVTAILDKPSPRVREARPELPAELDVIVDRCLAKEREARFKSAGELAIALLPFATPRSRVAAERAASMTPAFDVSQPIPISDRPTSSSDPPLSIPLSLDGETPGPSSPLSLTIRAAEIEGSKMDARKSPATTRRWLSITGFGGAATLAFVIGLALKDRTADKTATAAPAMTPSPTLARTELQPSAAGSPATVLPGATAPGSDPPPGPAATLAPLQGDTGRAELVIRASPSWAKITIDDKPVDNPALASYPKDGTTHRIVAKAWGYETKSTNVTVTADTIVDLGLDRRASATTAPAVASTPPPRAPKRPSPDSAPQAETAATKLGLSAVPAATALELNSSGGRAPMHPIETKDPYGGP
ncbi:MAG TPA: protein kinase [Polyangiaceae bacterium]|nr:protein kinase [Polyangiaceae bacterium]